jgi:hypothetical protein
MNMGVLNEINFIVILILIIISISQQTSDIDYLFTLILNLNIPLIILVSYFKPFTDQNKVAFVSLMFNIIGCAVGIRFWSANEFSNEYFIFTYYFYTYITTTLLIIVLLVINKLSGKNYNILYISSCLMLLSLYVGCIVNYTMISYDDPLFGVYIFGINLIWSTQDISNNQYNKVRYTAYGLNCMVCFICFMFNIKRKYLYDFQYVTLSVLIYICFIECVFIIIYSVFSIIKEHCRKNEDHLTYMKHELDEQLV